MTARTNWAEVTVRWGDYELTTRHLRANSAFVVAERDGDFAIDRQQLGAERVELVQMTERAAWLTVPEEFDLQLRRRTAGSPHRTVHVRRVSLSVGESARLRRGPLVIEVRVEAAAPAQSRWRARRFGDRRLIAALAAAVVTCAIPLAAGALTFEEPGPGIDKAQLRTMRSYLYSADNRAARASGAPTPRAFPPGTKSNDACAAQRCATDFTEAFVPCLDQGEFVERDMEWFGYLTQVEAPGGSLYCHESE
jgi:hypothetical protein